MNPLDQLRDEIANLHLLADRLASAKPHTPTLEECEQAFHEAYGNALRPGINLAGLAAVRDLCLASRFPSHDLVEAADAMRNECGHQEDCGLRTPFGNCTCGVAQIRAAYDSARARHAEGAKKEHVPVAQPEERARPKGEVAGSTPAGDTILAAADAMAGDLRHLDPESPSLVQYEIERWGKVAQPSGAPAKWRVEVVHGRARVIVDASGDSGEQSFWINDADTDDEPGHAEFHARMLRIAIGRILGAPAPAPLGTLPAFHTLEECREVFRRVTKRGPCLSSEDLHGIAAIRDFLTLTPEQFRENWGQQEDAPASAQGEVCECGHGRAMHFDEDGDHNGACLYQMNDKPFCRCDMFRAKDKERA